jgi:predicted metal-dependent hydrolase
VGRPADGTVDALAREGFAELAAGRPFEAHERFEDAWRLARGARAEAPLKGLAQLAAALVKAERGEPTGHAKLWRKSRARLRAEARGALAGIDLARLGAGLPEAPAPLTEVLARIDAARVDQRPR